MTLILPIAVCRTVQEFGVAVQKQTVPVIVAVMQKQTVPVIAVAVQ